MANERFDKIAAIFVLGHFHLFPADGYFIAITNSGYIMWRTILIAANGLKVGSDLVDITDISDQIHD